MRVPNIICCLLPIEDFFELSSVDVLRPLCCPHCKLPSRVPGRGLGLHGHGSVERSIHHVDSAGKPGNFLVFLRRYLCTRCLRTCRVEPLGLVSGFRYSLLRILLVMSAWTVRGLSLGKARSAWGRGAYAGFADPNRWRSPARWLRNACRLFGALGDGLGRGPRAAARLLLNRLLGAQILDGEVPDPAALRAALLRRTCEGGLGR